MTTVGHDPLRFITLTQKIVQPNGAEFKHDLAITIWGMLQKCRRLGDGEMKTVLVLVNNRNFDWKTKNTPKENANL
jgi:hypothetical protein